MQRPKIIHNALPVEYSRVIHNYVVILVTTITFLILMRFSNPSYICSIKYLPFSYPDRYNDNRMEP